MDTILDSGITPSSQPVKFAQFNRRFGALIVDSIILGFLSYISSEFNLNANNGSLLYWLLWLLQVLYSPLMEWQGGATLGKQMMKIVVVNQQFKKIGYREAFLRNIFGMLSLVSLAVEFAIAQLHIQSHWLVPQGNFSLGLIHTAIIIIIGSVYVLDVAVYLTNVKHQSLHDLIAGTHVIDAENELAKY